MPEAITEIRALLLQFEKSSYKDLYLRTADWQVFMARYGGAANPLQRGAAAAVSSGQVEELAAPHLGLFEPACACGDDVAVGALLGVIDVLGRKTELFSPSAGRIVTMHFAVNDLVEFGETLLEVEVAA